MTEQSSGAIGRVLDFIDRWFGAPEGSILKARECDVCGEETLRLQYEWQDKTLCYEHYEENKPPSLDDYYPPREYWRQADE